MRRKGELSAAMIDRDWPHQVAIDAASSTGAVHVRILAFCKPLSLARRGHTFVENGRYVSVYCFAVPEHADAFMREFGGRIIDPKDRPRWPGGRRR